MHHFADINWLAVVVATVSSFALGGIWYGPLFSKAWMKLTGMTKEKGAEASMAVTFGGTFALNLLIAIAIALLTGPHAGLHAGLHTGLFSAFFFVATSIGVIYLFEQRPLRLWLINAGYQVVNFSIMGSIIGAWP
ncbi:MAG: DUF1761 domain-containing protein [Proteobacteria bacterium]|jgi:Protein of unknown function (DUF1761)|nr:DUF1761 domain-containing protein [Pseudomonadota bacterium]MBK7115341.1 DUF1761 domain-containing protein [Pseudomonadota bacterium]MBK9253644.1 DUF1761 domain-containing protein [Pseudomonadota bacterium]MCC6630477.1 DUF1761 domain-containing protein [Gammaproteobacteria bacterium]